MRIPRYLPRSGPGRGMTPVYADLALAFIVSTRPATAL